MSILGCIADSTTVDTVSTNPTATYPIQSHGGDNITCNTIYSDGAKIKHLDRTTKPTDVTGVPIQPLIHLFHNHWLEPLLLLGLSTQKQGVFILRAS